jgi:hypothetical protein
VSQFKAVFHPNRADDSSSTKNRGRSSNLPLGKDLLAVP